MIDPSALSPNFWPFVLYFLAAVILVAGMLGLSYLLGQRHNERSTGEPYESGVVSTGTARMRYDIKFYRNAMFFVVFDIEALFILAWAVVARQAGWAGYIEIVVFIAILFVALIYLIRRGALDWAPSRERRSSIEKKGE